MREPRWLKAARAQIGQKEIAGRKHNPRILQWWTLIRAGFTDDETPWCAGFVGGMLESVGIKSSRSAAARSYLKWGDKLSSPIVGCIVVFSRGSVPGAGHVGFYVGRDTRGNLLILGGNQGDAVNIKPFAASRALGYRWPTGEPFPSVVAPVDPVETEEPVSNRESFMSSPDDPGVVGEDEPDDTMPHAAPEGDRKTGITEGAKVAGGLSVAGIFSQIWEVLYQTPETILQALVAAASKPAFWVFAGGVGVASYIYWRRSNMKKAP